jgi:hypothetical protein
VKRTDAGARLVVKQLVLVPTELNDSSPR